VSPLLAAFIQGVGLGAGALVVTVLALLIAAAFKLPLLEKALGQ